VEDPTHVGSVTGQHVGNLNAWKPQPHNHQVQQSLSSLVDAQKKTLHTHENDVSPSG